MHWRLYTYVIPDNQRHPKKSHKNIYVKKKKDLHSCGPLYDFNSLTEGGSLGKDHLIVVFGISSRVLCQIEDDLNQFIQIYYGQMWGLTFLWVHKLHL